MKEHPMKPTISHPALCIQKQRATRPLHLTPRELEVLALLCEGLPNKLISRRLNISAATVKCHISRILDELGVSSRLQAVVVAARFGLIGDAAAEPAAPAVARPAEVPHEAANRSIASRAFISALV
jgi:DNA-binding CsgD family transcriptional regulator